MSTEQGQNQLDKWRRQERFNKILVRSVLGFLICLALAGITFLLMYFLRGAPTLTPAELREQWAERHGQTVRVKGRVTLVREPLVRVGGDQSISIACTFNQFPADIKAGDEITVEGKVSGEAGLINCHLVRD